MALVGAAPRTSSIRLSRGGRWSRSYVNNRQIKTLGTAAKVARGPRPLGDLLKCCKAVEHRVRQEAWGLKGGGFQVVGVAIVKEIFFY